MLWAIIVLATVMLFNMFQQPQSNVTRVPFTEFLNKVDEGQLVSVTMQGQTLTGRTADNHSIQTYAPRDTNLVQRLIEKGGNQGRTAGRIPWYMTLLVSWFPMLLLVGVWIFFMRQMQGGGGKAMSFGRSRARLLNQEGARVTFADVAGVDEAKEELSEVVEFLSNPKNSRVSGQNSQGRPACGPSRNRQDPSGARCRRRGRSAVFLDFGFGFCGNVCWRGSFQGSRSLCAGQEKCSMPYFYRRN